MGTINPWLAMWTQPRNAIRFILQTHKKYGVLLLAFVYALQKCFYLAHHSSLGLIFSFSAIILSALILSPFIGIAWLYISGAIFSLVGRWLKGRGTAVDFRAALAWSKIPMSLSLFMWLILSTAFPSSVFIMDAGGASSVFIHFISLILWTWSFILLFHMIREIQLFSRARSWANLLIGFALYWVVSFAIFCFVRYIYLLVV